MESGSKVLSESKRLSLFRLSEEYEAKSEMVSQDRDHTEKEIELTESNREELKSNKRQDSIERCSEKENGIEQEDVEQKGNGDAEKAQEHDWRERQRIFLGWRERLWIDANYVSGGCCDAILQNPFIRLMKRIMPLCLALWHYADIGLDINQTLTYHEMAYDKNGSYTKWALRYQNEINFTHLEKVSSWYFYTASIVWIGPSFFLAMESFAYKSREMTEKILDYNFCCCKAENKIFGKCLRIVLIILFLPFGTVISFLLMYLLLPLNMFYNAVRAVIEGDDFEESDDYGCPFDAHLLMVMKGFQILGETLPQVILNVVFISNNYLYLKENDIYFGIPIPISIVSAVFSIGSLVMGCRATYLVFGIYYLPIVRHCP